ncbi:MAG: type II 3-dehydroquinate dehydratase [Dehalococcoidia bacterium]|nr:type II 3-dehydroquinate dehydratase [Dehalococcoidia bacterium]
MRLLVVHGPNLNMLGRRDRRIYGDKTLEEINKALEKLAERLKVDLTIFQANSEGAIIDFIQEHYGKADGIIINPGALSHYGLSLRDALADTNLPIIEVHLSNIYAREDWRARSVIAPVSRGQISGLGWRGYLLALEAIVSEIKGKD